MVPGLGQTLANNESGCQTRLPLSQWNILLDELNSPVRGNIHACGLSPGRRVSLNTWIFNSTRPKEELSRLSYCKKIFWYSFLFSAKPF
jgi:hypothetical protein